MSKISTIKQVSFPNGYIINLPYEVAIDCNEDKEIILFEILIKQIIKLKEELNE